MNESIPVGQADRRRIQSNWHHATAMALSLCLLTANSWAADETRNTEYDPGAATVRITTPNTVAQRSLDEPQGQVRSAARRYEPGEFELYVNRQLGMDLSEYATPLRPTSADTRPPLRVRRLGADLVADAAASNGAEGPRVVGPDYIVGIGDEIQVTLWGSVDADLRLVVDRVGRINIPRIGPIMVAGVRYGELNDVVRARVAQVFKSFQVSTALGRLRSFRIYVTGFTQQPGPYTVSSLSTVVTGLLQAGGPSAAGSFRQIEVRRAGKTVSHFDIYDLLLRGDKSADIPLQAEDVIYIAPVGTQAAVLGSVNRASIVELKPGETVSDILAMAGGFSAVADRSRLAIERLSDRYNRRIEQLDLPAQGKALVANGDVVRAFSGVEATLAQDHQFKHVRVEGEVLRPGSYLLSPDSTLQDALQAAGGLAPQAYVFGTDFSRESVRKTQQENYDRALRDLETDFTKSTSTRKAVSADEAIAQTQQAAGNSRLIEQLRSIRPTGRIVLQLEPGGSELPHLLVEDGDRLTIPARPNTVGVFGSVFNAGNYLLVKGSTLEDVMKLAGGAKKGADTGSIFVLRANGSVVSARQSSGSGWLSFGSGVENLQALPGDTVFVPEELDKTTFAQAAQQWTQILYQFGLGAAALKTIRN